MLTEEHLASIDHRLYGTTKAIETCRTDLCEFRGVLNSTQQSCVAYENAYREQKWHNAEWCRIYQLLYSEHLKAIQDLADVAEKYRSLQKDFESAQTATLAQEAVQEYERHIAEQATLERMAREVDTIKKQLETQATDLEKENTELHNALADANSLIFDLERKVNELQCTNRKEAPGIRKRQKGGEKNRTPDQQEIGKKFRKRKAG